MNSIKINENLTLSQIPEGLTFGTDAYLLSAYLSPSQKKRAVELGAGTGVISLLCQSKNKFSHIYAVEIQETFARLVEENAKGNGLSDKITAIHSDIRDITSAATDGEVELVFANPPYMKADAGKKNTHDEKFIARHEVYGTVDDFCACAYRLLKHGGKLCVVYRPDRLTDLLCAMRDNRIEPKVMIFVHAHPQATPSMVIVEGIKGGASGNKLLRPLFLSDNAEDSKRNILSADAKQIYDTCSFEAFLKRV